MTTYRDLSPEDAHAELTAVGGVLRILDVRMHHEHAQHHVEGAQLIPIQELAQRVHELDKDIGYLVFCEHGVRSIAACELLGEHGFVKLINVIGGMAAWTGAGLPNKSASTH